MKKIIIPVMIWLLFGFTQIMAQTSSTSDNLVAQPIPDRTVPFRVTDAGVSKPIIWGLDLAWASESNFRRGIAFMGANRVDIVRSSFTPTSPLINGGLGTQEMDWLNNRLNLIGTWLGPNTNLVLNCDHPSVDSWYSGNASRWAQLIDTTAKLHEAAGHNVVTVSPFNEPDYGWGQGSMQDFYNICVQLKQNPYFNNIRISGGNTLNNDQALTWYDFLKANLDEGNTHQLAGSFNTFASFYQTVRANGDHASGDELHNVMEAMVGVEYGMQTGIWWGTAELARGEFVKASDGERLAYAEHRPNWTAASVYRAPGGKIQAFSGGSERQAVTTSYNFISKDRAVYYDGHGPQREYTLVMPGGTGYQQGQTNAERVVNITWGDDIQPVINGRYVLVNRNSGMVMEVAGGSTSAGANLQQGTNTGATYQQWDVTPVSSQVGGDFSYVTMLAVHSGKTPDIYNWSLDDGGNIVVWDDTKNANQQWYLEYGEDGWFYIRSRYSAKCLEVVSSSTANGANIQQWEKDNGTNQQWRFVPVGAPIEFNAPGAPTNLTATAQAASIRLTWSASPASDVAGYTIFRKESVGGAYSTIARNVTTTSFVDNTALLGTQYYYAVKAVDNSLNRSAYSNEVSATPTGNNDLVTHLKFDGNTLDNTIHLNHSAPYGGVSFGTGRVGTGSVALNGSNAFIQLPADLANHQNISIAAWVYWNGGAAWQRVFDFGNDQAQNMFLTPSSGSGQLRFAIKNGGGEQVLSASALPTGTWSHVAVTLGGSGASMYVNGQLVAQSNTFTISPLDFKPVLNYIGRSQYPDPLFNGRIDDFRVHNHVLSATEVAQLAGVETFYQLRNRSTGLYLDGMGRTTNGDNCGQWANATSYNSYWELVDAGSGYYQLQNRSTGLFLDGMGRTTNGAACGQWASTNHQNSHWTVEQYDGNYYRIRNRATGLYLDGMGRTTDGSDVAQWANTADPNAQWELVNPSSARMGNLTGVEDIQEPNGISIFPNPTSDVLNIVSQSSNPSIDVMVMDILSRTVIDTHLSGTNNQLDLSKLKPGIYFLKTQEAGMGNTTRIVKQ